MHLNLNFKVPYYVTQTTVKSHVKALGLYNFINGFGWAYKRAAHIRGGGGRGGIAAE